MAGRVVGRISGRHTLYGGRYRIRDYVSRLGVFGRYRVRLFVRSNGAFIREKFSDGDGLCDFQSIKYIEKGYFAIAYDHTSNDLRNAAIADLITPEPMP